MNTIFYDSPVDDDSRRRQLYNGQLFVFSPRPSTIALCDHARQMIVDAFKPLDPRTARFDIPVEKYAAQHIKIDTRVQPKPEEPVELDPQIRPICPPGGLILFSAAQLHWSVPNTSGYTRVSIDFRTVHLGDAINGIGAHNIDSQCTGTTMNAYPRDTDLSHIPEEVIRKYDTPPQASVA